MANSIPSSTIEKFTTFGDLLRFLRRRAGITQLELSIAVGYSGAQISRLEQNLRIPDLPTIEARFISPLSLEDEPRAIARLLELASSVRREDAPTVGICPYKGLDYFDETDADLFAGREALTEQLVNGVLSLTLTEHAPESRFFTIVGASGSGKSSLVRAGLVSTLRWNKVSSNWPIYVLTPTAHPLESLATALTREISSIAASTILMDDLARDQRTLGIFTNRELKNTPGSYLLIVIDQFEELFALCRSEVERSAFIDNLLAAACDADGRAIIIITLRADFYVHCSSYLGLRKAIARRQEYIGAMSDKEMRRAIEEPAQRGHWDLEPGLTDLILHDVGYEPGALPLLSHALYETWQRRRGRILTFSGYASSGGVRGSIAETAESVFTDQFTHEQQAIARRIFLRLTELGDETATGDTRRKVTFDELILKPEEKEATQAVLKVLADARLVTTSENSVQVAHEALIREWPTLRNWLEENREGLHLHRQLTESAQDWQAAGGELGMLFRGARLAQASEWAASHAEDMNPLEKEFLEASIASSDREAAEREATHQRELEAAQKLADIEREQAKESRKSAQRLKQRAILVSVVGAIAILLAIFAIFAWYSSASQATFSHSLSLAGAAQSLNDAGQGDLALLLAMETVKSKQPPSEALTTLRMVSSGFGRRAILTGHSQSVQAVAISPDGKTALSGSCTTVDSQGDCLLGELILWDLGMRQELFRWSAHYNWVTAVAYSLDGLTLISGSRDGSLLLWDMAGEQKGSLVGHSGSISDMLIVQGSGYLLSGSADGLMILWDLKNTSEIMRFETPGNPVTSIAYAADVANIVSAHQDGSLMLWDFNGSQPIKHFYSPVQGIVTVAISPDASRIIYSTGLPNDFYIYMIDGKSGDMLREKMFAGVPGDLVLSPDFSYFLLACSNRVIQVDIQNWNILGNSVEPNGIQNAVAISKDGSLGLTASQDGTINIWNLVVQFVGPTINFDSDGLFGIATSPDNKYLLLSDASKNGYDQPALWDITERKIVRTYTGFNAITIGTVTISPDNRFVAATGLVEETGKSLVAIWDRKSGDLQCKYEGLLEGGRALAFSPDSKSILVGYIVFNTTDGHLILLDTECNVVRQFNTSEEVTSVSFSADGTRAVTGSSRLGRAVLWDVATGEQIRSFSVTTGGPMLTAVFGPGDRTILGSGIGELYLWDIEADTPPQRFTGTTTPICLTLSPDGKYVLSGHASGDVILWDFKTGEKLNHININDLVSSVVVSSDGKTAFASSQGGKLIEWPIIVKSLPELLDWIALNRYVRSLTEAEKLQYHIEP
jgi:WD40 repeat protein